MADKTTGLPSWLISSKEDIIKTKEWHDLSSEVFEAVQQQLAESHVPSFSDLTDSEKIMFLERGAKLVRDGSCYHDLTSTVSVILDRNINQEVTQIMSSPLNTNTKTELILQEALKASVNLLQRWPDLKNKLLACLNRPLPPDLRKAIWKLFLSNPVVRQEYLKNRKETTTPLEASIQEKCEAFLMSESSFRNLATHPAVLRTMKTALSYRHVYLRGSSTVADTDYLLAVPFLKALIADNHLNQLETDDIIASFIEVYFSFMDSRPHLMKDSRSKEFLAALKQYGNTLASILRSKNRYLAETLDRLLSQDKPAQLAESVAALMRSHVRCMFVGFLSLDVVCYVWDQYIVSLKRPAFHCIATFSAALLMLLSKQLMSCRNGKDIQEVLRTHGRTLTVRDFQKQIDSHFMDEWQTLVTEAIHGSELPLVDPVTTMGRTAQTWSFWFRGQPPSRQRLEDRRQTREERQEDKRRRQLEELQEEARRRREAEEKSQVREREMRQEFEEKNQQEKRRIARLEEELKREKEDRVESDKVKDQEIRRLQAELHRLRATPTAGPSLVSVPLPLSPAPGAESVKPSPEAPRSADQQAEELVRSLLGGVLHSLERVAHGTEEQRKNLDLLTRAEFEKNSEEYKEVERELFDRELRKEDWDRMDPEQRSENVERLMKKLQDKRHQRQNETA